MVTFFRYLVVFLVASFLRQCFTSILIISTTTRMHHAMTRRVVGAPVLFYDKNPVGRILTRFSKDITMLDNLLTFLLPLASYGIFRAAAVAVALT